MLICKLEIWPDQDAARAYSVGEVRILQTAGDCFVADYAAELDKASRQARKPGVWRKADVHQFDHSYLGPYDLLLRALIACLGGRSFAAIEAIAPSQSTFGNHEQQAA